MEFIDKNNQVHKIDVNNPDPNKKYTVAADDFYATGGDGYLESNKNPEFVIQKFDLDKNKLACDYIKKFTNPSKKLSKALIQPKCKIIEMARIKLMGKPQYIAFEYLFIFTPVFNNVFYYFTTYVGNSTQSITIYQKS